MKVIEIFGQENCRHCVRAVAYARSRNLQFTYHDIADQAARQEMFRRNPAAETVPQIFIGDSLIGGCDDLLARPIEEIRSMMVG